MTGIEPRVLNDDRDVRFEHRRIIGIPRNGSGIFQIIETQMQCTPWRDCHVERTNGLAIRKKYSEGDVRLFVTGIENARGLVADQRVIGKRAFRWYPPFGNSPIATSDGLHRGLTSLCSFLDGKLFAARRFRTMELFYGWTFTACAAGMHAAGAPWPFFTAG
jgi:hypothetical protein